MKNFDDLKIGTTIKINTVDCEIVDIFVHYNPFEKEFITKMVLRSGKNNETWDAKQVFKFMQQ